MVRSILLLIITGILCCPHTYAQRKCGIELVKAGLIARDPSWAQRIEDQRASLQGIADTYKTKAAADRIAGRTTSASPVPVIFHILVTAGEYDSLGGTAGIAQRVDSQIAVLNRDYNALNTDASLIPSGWTHLYGNVGIHFGLAHTSPSGYGSPGYEINIIPNSPGGFSGASNSYSDVKHASTGGFDAWDQTKYINVWCTNFVDYPGLLGITVAPSFTGAYGYPEDEVGICMYWEVLGKRASATDHYPTTGWASDYYDEGRTLTHETGHLFEIWHTWGDDGGACPWNGGHDDGLADTPPEGNYKYYNYPDTIPGGTYYDGCEYDTTSNVQPYGVASLDYMNYTDDIAMHMFTTDQAAVMASMVAPGGESYSLTQNPDLLNWSTKTAVSLVEMSTGLVIFPNPTTGMLNITFSSATAQLQDIYVTDILGQEMLHKGLSGQTGNNYSIDLSAMSKGIYFVRCNFASGSITRKILLQ